ncbi:MAG: hypothetical protein ACREAC_20640, partial [Blastocatellia bacterium]
MKNVSVLLCAIPLLAGLTPKPPTIPPGRSDRRVVRETAPTETRLPGKPGPNSSPVNLPLIFENNDGQYDPRVKFAGHGAGYVLLLSDQGASVCFNSPRRSNQPFRNPRYHLSAISPAPPSVINIRPVGMRKSVRVTATGELKGKLNYLLGRDQTKWRTGISTYALVQYTGVYPGIDLTYHGSEQQLEYDFDISPGAKPELIKLTFDGAGRPRINDKGALIIPASSGEIVEPRPVAYQEINGKKRFVRCSYRLRGRREVGFALGTYERSRTLVIDPLIVYSTLLAGGGQDQCLG